MPETILDLRGIRCPQVVLSARKALRDVAIGEVLVLECTDPLAAIDVPLFVMQTGQKILSEARSNELLTYKILRQR